MAKMKTKSSAKKRFKKVNANTIKYWHTSRRHLLTKKTAKRKRQLRRSAYISNVDLVHIARLLPY